MSDYSFFGYFHDACLEIKADYDRAFRTDLRLVRSIPKNLSSKVLGCIPMSSDVLYMRHDLYNAKAALVFAHEVAHGHDVLGNNGRGHGTSWREKHRMVLERFDSPHLWGELYEEFLDYRRKSSATCRGRLMRLLDSPLKNGMAFAGDCVGELIYFKDTSYTVTKLLRSNVEVEDADGISYSLSKDAVVRRSNT